MVGSSGNSADGFALVTAIAFSRPDWTCADTEAALANESWTSPLSTPITAAPAPLKGMCEISTRAMALNSSAERWGEAPMPLVE